MTRYIAHIITAEAGGLSGVEVVIMAAPGEQAGEEVSIATYPVPETADAGDILSGHGWIRRGEESTLETGHSVVDVAPQDWEAVVQAATYARAQAQTELDRRDAAWRQVIGDAMRDGGTKKGDIVRAAGVSTARAYQIRDGRR